MKSKMARDRWDPWYLVDGSSIFLFRFGFGFLMAWWAWDYLVSGRVKYMYVEPKVHFSLFLEWVKPWPGPGMYLHFVALVLLSLCVAFGLFYRITSIALAIGFSYVFLLEKSNYQNHYYLMVLVSWLMTIVPAAQSASVDCNQSKQPSDFQLQQWNLWAIRFLIGVPYLYGGIAKLSSDWFAGCPLRQTIQSYKDWPLMGSLLSYEATAQILIWGGLLFDLTIVPLLMIRRTRLLAYAMCVGFHVSNSVLFHIHVFPWFMIVATTIFFDPDWPRRWLAGPTWMPADSPIDTNETVSERDKPTPPRAKRIVLVGLASILVVVQLVLPFRHWLYSGDVNWTEQGHMFSWRMMLRGKISVVRFYLTDERAGKTWTPSLREFINADQLSRMAMDPAMILEMGRFLEAQTRAKTGSTVQVRALALTSLNGRKPQMLVNPEMDISSHSKDFTLDRWIAPLTEPLSTTPWQIPVEEWEKHVELPKLPVVNSRPPS